MEFFNSPNYYKYLALIGFSVLIIAAAIISHIGWWGGIAFIVVVLSFGRIISSNIETGSLAEIAQSLNEIPEHEHKEILAGLELDPEQRAKILEIYNNAKKP
jgi:hypothetical protein